MGSEPTAPAVYQAIALVMADLSREGIAKARKNQQQGYSFRGIDDVYNALSGVLSRHKLVMLPRVLSRESAERQTQKGGTLFYVVIDMEFDIICAIDGSKHTIRIVGEAMDSADKATNKAMSAAYKYAAMQAFCIPTEGDNDADATTPEPVQPRKSDEARRSAHDAMWERDRAKFCAALAGLGFPYEAVATWCDEQGWGRPSGWPSDQRVALVSDLKAGQANWIPSLCGFIAATNPNTNEAK